MKLTAGIGFGVLTLLGGCTCSGSGSDATVVPAELADEGALALFDPAVLPIFAEGRRDKSSSADRETRDPVELALWEHGNRDMNNFVCASSDADAPPNRVRFNYELAECPERYVRGVVLGRFEGSGRLARLWLTASSFRESPPDREQLRIWVDDVPKPLLDVPLREAIDGTAGEMFAPPFGAGSTRRMAWYYPVVFSKKIVVALDRLGSDDLYFHQVDVVLDPSPHERRAAPKRLARRDTVQDTLRAGFRSETHHSKSVSLASGQRVTALELDGPATIVKTAIGSSIGQEALRRVIVSVRWDDESAPAIELPVTDLFAAFDAAPEPSSPFLGARTAGGKLELWLGLPMPFASLASWSFENRGEAPLDLDLSLDVASGVPQRPWGRLSVQRNETEHAGPQDHRLASTTGRGRLAGVCMSLQGHGMMEGARRGHPMHFLEGDEALRIDGRSVLGGTGTEDYFDSSFYFDDGPRATFFAQVWAINTAPAGGRASACRWHVLGDTIDFAQSLDLTMEVGPGVPEVLDRYRSVAFVYR